MSFTLGSIATVGLPVGRYALTVTDVEAGTSTKSNPKITFKATVASTDNPQVKVGTKHVWSYTYQKEWINIIGNDLIRAGLPKETQITGDAKNDANVYSAAMRGQTYTCAVVEQKNNPPNTNTSFVGPYGAQVPQAAPAVAQPMSVAPPMPSAPTGFAPTAAVAPQQFQMAPPSFAPAPAPIMQAPPAPVAPVAEVGLDSQTVAALMAGQRPQLNNTQMAQLAQFAPQIANEYASAQFAQAQAPAPAPVAQPQFAQAFSGV